MRILSAGKLPAEALERLLAALPRADARVVLGPNPGEDAAVVDMGDRYLVATTDPITFATNRIGWYSVHVNANDIAVMGAIPRWFFAVLLLPAGLATEETAETITGDIARTCEALHITLCGGHTEVTPGLDRPIVVGQMLGEVEREGLVRKDRIQAGDRILLTRGAAIEGTAILAREKRHELERSFDAQLLERASRLLFDPGISVVEAARVATAAGPIHAMHDPTEGGIATALWERARASGRGLRVVEDAIPILPETRALCSHFGLDPLRLIASGALLLAVAPSDADCVARALAESNIPVADVGEARDAGDGIQIECQTGWTPLEPAERDEIARVFER